MKSIERKPRRIALAVISVVVIAIMWINKDILGLWQGVSAENALPFVMTNLAVTAVKIVLIAGAAWLIKKVIMKIKNK